MTLYARQAYQQTAVNAIYDKERLVVMVFEGIEGFLQQARDGIMEGHKARKGEGISSVLALLTELDCALDRDAGGEMAENLSNLYGWMMTRLTEANLHDDADALNQVEKVVTELKEGFEGAAQQLAPRPAKSTQASDMIASALGLTAPLSAPSASKRVSRAV